MNSLEYYQCYVRAIMPECDDCGKHSQEVQDVYWHRWEEDSSWMGDDTGSVYEVEKYGVQVCRGCLRAYVSDGTDESYFSQCASGMA